METVKFNRMPLSELAAGQISEYIIKNALKPGSRLPNETQLSEILNVGRSTVREAVRILVSRNVVRIVRGHGTVVSQQPGVADDPLGFEFFENKHKLILDLLELRCVIEPPIAAFAARRASAENVARMEALAAEIERRTSLKQDYLDLDIKLHRCIAESSCNEVVTLLNPIIHKSIYLFTQLLEPAPEALAPGEPAPEALEGRTGVRADRRIFEEANSTHQEIVRKIREQDAEGAQAAMLRHIRNNQQLIEQNLPG